MPLTPDAKRAFMSESVAERPIELLTFSHPSFGDLRLTSNDAPFTSRGEVYTPAPFLSVAHAPSQPGQVPAVDFAIGINDQAIVASLRSIDDSPIVTLELVLQSDPDTVQKRVTNLRMQSVELGLLRIRMELGVFGLFQSVGPKLAYTPDVAPGAFT